MTPHATMSAVLLGVKLQAMVSSLGIKSNGATAQFDFPVELLPLLMELVPAAPGSPAAPETTGFPRDRTTSRAGGGFAVRAPPPARAKADLGESISDSRPAPLLGQKPAPTESSPTPQQTAAEKAATHASGKKTPTRGPDSGNSDAARSRRFYFKMRKKRQAKAASRVARVGACGTGTAAGTHQKGQRTGWGAERRRSEARGACA
jgi:hypothetical protein